MMNAKTFALIVFVAALVVGCASYEGASRDEYGSSTNQTQVYPQAAASPTFRPGINPYDPRDAHFTTRPQP